MNNEEFERQTRFILEQQARFDASLARQRELDEAFWAKQKESWAKQDESWAKQKESWAKQDEYWAKQKEYNAQVNERLDRTDRQIAELRASDDILREALVGLTYHAERFELEMADLVARGKETDARLNALILVVERHINGHQ